MTRDTGQRINRFLLRLQVGQHLFHVAGIVPPEAVALIGKNLVQIGDLILKIGGLLAKALVFQGIVPFCGSINESI